MAQSEVFAANGQCIRATLDALAQEVTKSPDQFGPAGESDQLVAELQVIRELVHQAQTLLQDDSAGLRLDALTEALSNLAELRFDCGVFAAALNIDRWALSIRRAQPRPRPLETALALRNVARDHFHLGDYAAAARLSEESLSIVSEAFAVTDPKLLPFLDSLAAAYEQAGRLEEARLQAEKALDLAEASFGANDHHLVPALQTLGSTDRCLGRMHEAYFHAERALTIERATSGPESFQAARAAGRLAGIVAQIGDRPRARTMFEQALAVLQKLPPGHAVNNEIAATLTNLAGMADPDEAARLYEEALSLRRSIFDSEHPEIVHILSHLGLVYCRRGENARALAIWDECLDRRRRLHGAVHPDVARSLIDVAYPLWRLDNDHRRSTRALLEAIAILACYDMRAVAARANSLLASVIARDCLAAGVFFAKLTVNTLQDLRLDANLRDDADGAFVAARQHSYRQLGNGLIVSGRLPEAQQALEMLKEVELFEIGPGDLDPRVTRASLTPLETCWVQRAQEILQRMKAQFATVNRNDDEKCKDEELDSRSRLEQLLAHTATELEQWFEGMLGAFKQTERRSGSAAAANVIEPDLVLRRAIPPEAAFLQYLLAGDQLQIVMTSSELLRHYDVRFSRGEVHQLVYSMRTALQEGASDFLNSARRLYDILIAPVVGDLRSAHIRTLALSLDGPLRYLPLAALHDGTRYLLDEYALIICAGRPTDKTPIAGRFDLRAYGLGVTRAIPPHSALYGVREELTAAIRTVDNDSGVLPGVIRLDEAFSRQALDEALFGGFPIVHIASHFAFCAAQEAASYLLMGDGSTLTLADLARLKFNGVELIVLSACDTATGGGHQQSGREIEGLGALARHQGARNVIATLWPVRDLTTALLMRRFYESCFQQGMPLPEGLRRAQLSLRGASEAAAESNPGRGLVPPRNDMQAVRWDHPRYWAPYLLMGGPWAASPGAC